MTMIENPAVPEDLEAQVRQAVKDQFNVTDAWKPKPRVRFVVQCPSGQTILVQHLTTMDLLEADLIEDMDFFTKELFGTEAVEGQEDSKGEEQVWTVLRDVNKRFKFYVLLNKIMAVFVVRPKVIDDGVQIVTNSQGKQIVKLGVNKGIKLKEHEVLASAIDFVDRMEIFANLNKPLDEIKPFRLESSSGMADLESVPKAADKTE